jgi:predicted MFS family arabinose efflux permease
VNAKTTPIARPLALLMVGRLVVNAAHRFVYPFLPAIARGLGVSLESAGTLVSARWLGAMATPAVVHAVDRGRRPRRLILMGMALFALGAAVTAAAGAFWGALVGFAAMGLAKSMYDVSGQAYLAGKVPYARRARNMGTFELTWAGGFLLGAPAAGWLIDRYGWEAPFWAAAVLAGLVVILLGVVLEPVDHTAGATRLGLDRSGFALLGVMGLVSGASEIVFVSLGAWLEDAFGLSLLVIGGVATILGLAEITGEGATVAVTDRLGKRRAVALGVMSTALAYGLMPLAETAIVAGITLLAVALAAFEFTIVSSIPLASEVVPGARARYLSLTVLAMGIGRGAGAFFGPRLFLAAGLAGPTLVAAGTNVAAALVLVWLVREHAVHAA